ncbi:MAG: tetratricopeptide repeat protein [Elusimicrobiota bacterium]|nr:tetratricopeptide repeat protein [Elusimicrobiota bacterium]
MTDKKNDLCAQAEKFIFAGDYASALKKALSVNKKKKEKERAGKLLVWIYRMMGKPAKALFYLKQSPVDADSLCEEAILYRMLCDFKTARKKISSALRIYKASKDKEGIAFAHWTRGGIERYGGNPKKGFFYFQKARSLTKEPSAKGYVLCGMGGTARLIGNYAFSEKCYLLATKIFSRRKEKFGIAYSSCGLGSAARMKKDFKKSEKLYKKAVSIYEKINDRWNMAYSMWGLAQTAWFLGRKKEALKINRACVKIFREFSDPRGVFYCYIQEANFLRMESGFKKAAALLSKSASTPSELSLVYEKGLLREQQKLIKQKNSRVLLIA